MNNTLIKYIFGSVIGLIAWSIPYFFINTPLASALSTAVATYCNQPQSDRLNLRLAIASLLVKGDDIEIHCAGDK